MWEVGKKYTTADNTDPRECLKVTDTYVLLDAQEKFPHSRPVSVEKVHWDCWKEYKEPIALKAWVPIVRYLNETSPYFNFNSCSIISKQNVEDYLKRSYPNHTILDIIEVTWQEKE